MPWEQIFQDSLKAGFRPETIYFALAAIGLNIHFGFTGLLNFGQAGFMAIGAYGLAIPTFAFGAPLWVGVPCALLASVLFALLLGYPTLRLRSDYLAMVTIAAAEIVRLLLRASGFSTFTGGSNGINGFADGFFALNPFDTPVGFSWSVFDFTYNAREAWVMTVGWTLVLLGAVITFLLMRSPWGRVLISIREDENVTKALGKNAFAFKVQSLIIGGLFGSVAGMMLAVSQGSVQATPGDLGPPRTFVLYAALILGGTARIWGPIIGSFLFVLLLSLADNLIRAAQAEEYLDVVSDNQVGAVRFIIVGATLMALMAFRPQGIFGDRREMRLDA